MTDLPQLLTSHPAALLLAPVSVALLIGPRGARAPWRTAVDGPLLVGLGLAVALVCEVWLVGFLLPGGSTASDFGEYCEGIAELRGIPNSLPAHNRSRATAWVVAQLSRPLGVIGGLHAAAALGLGLTAACVGLCARVLHSRLAAVAAALSVGALVPLVLLSRTFSYYPLVTAGFAMAATGACLLGRSAHPLAYAAAGVGAGLALLADLRGLIFVLPVVGLGLLGLLRRPWPLAPVRALALALPLLWSHGVGPWAYPRRHAVSLERQADLPNFALILEHPHQTALQLRSADSAFLWGTSDLRELPLTLAYLRRFSALGPGSAGRQALHDDGYRSRVKPWLVPTGGALLIALFALRRQPWAALGLLAALAPWAANLRGAVQTQASEWRFLAVGAPGVAVLFGLAYAALATAWARGPTRGAGATGRLLLAAAPLPAILLGALPSPLGPVSPWKQVRLNGSSQVEKHLEGEDPRWPGCAAAIAEDRARGLIPPKRSRVGGP